MRVRSILTGVTRAAGQWCLRDARCLREDEVRRLLAAARRHSQKAHVLLSLCYNGAFRACEVTHLRVKDFDFSANKVSIVPAKKARRSGAGLPPAVDYPLAENAMALASKWIILNELGPQDWMFSGQVIRCKVVKYECSLGHMSTREAQRIFSEVASRVGLKLQRRGIHSLKHARLTEIAYKTRDPWFVKQAGRHESIAMSDAYVAVLDLTERIRKIGGIV